MGPPKGDGIVNRPTNADRKDWCLYCERGDCPGIEFDTVSVRRPSLRVLLSYWLGHIFARVRILVDYLGAEFVEFTTAAMLLAGTEILIAWLFHIDRHIQK